MGTKVIKKKGMDVEQVATGVTPPPPSISPAFPQKPRLTGKSKKRDIPEGALVQVSQVRVAHLRP